MTEDKTARYSTRRKISDFAGGAGLILIVVGLLIPLLNLGSTALMPVAKWVYTAGALMFVGSKCVRVNPAGSSLRMRSLRRMEFWAGVCFLIGAGFWFYNSHKLGASPYAGPLAIVRDTILFSLSGAVIQLVAAWMIYFREKKEARLAAEAAAEKGKGKDNGKEKENRKKK